ncbi:MAG: 1-deoxy-D-xylulose-5-phosphate reductoisomerase [Spirochaetales bacterium]|nr:1-deoxy-D-xylulose-5-phosphate reductoisomerase [Spirochaetales bacterium]
MKKKIIILGSTGSIGRNTIDVISSQPEKYEISAISAHNNEKKLNEIADRFKIKNLALTGKKPDNPSIKYYSKAGLLDMINDTQADIVVNGLAGSDGLMPSVVSLKSGKNLALANKETVVMAGCIITQLAADCGKKIIPVDSEHSAIFHLLQNSRIDDVEELIITASGGAFRDLSLEEMKNVKLEDALKHPNWSMGRKLTIDSASMANKGLEVIEAHQLFNFPLSKIKVLIHPQSMVHSLIRTAEGSLFAQISSPDMRVPIQNALSWPEIGPSLFGRLDLDGITLNFTAPDLEKYRMLALAYNAAESGPSQNITYNASNEIAVDYFMQRKIAFKAIPEIVEKTLQTMTAGSISSIEDIIDVDTRARRTAEKYTGDYINN